MINIDGKVKDRKMQDKICQDGIVQDGIRVFLQGKMQEIGFMKGQESFINFYDGRIVILSRFNLEESKFKFYFWCIFVVYFGFIQGL